MVQADASALGLGARPDPEQAQVVVVARAGQTEKGGVGAWFEGDDLHAEQVAVEALAALEVGDEQDGMVETDRGERHE